MKIDTISSFAINNGLRTSTTNMQARLAELQLEISTGRYADIGLELGGQTRSVVSFENDVSYLQRQIDTNGRALTRAAMTQVGMSSLVNLSDELVSNVALVADDRSQRGTVVASAENLLGELSTILNTQSDGSFIFGGQRTDQPPVEAYIGGPAQTVFRNAFQTYFGFTIDDPAGATITPAQITDFLDNVAEPLFTGAGWTTNVSQASSDEIVSRIADGITLKTSVSANEEAFSDMMFGAIVAYELYSSEIAGDALFEGAEISMTKVASSVSKVTQLQGSMGMVQQRLEDVSTRHKDQIDLFNSFVADVTAVDTYAASSELSSLLTQIQISYTITSRVQQLTLTDYIR